MRRSKSKLQAVICRLEAQNPNVEGRCLEDKNILRVQMNSDNEGFQILKVTHMNGIHHILKSEAT